LRVALAAGGEDYLGLVDLRITKRQRLRTHLEEGKQPKTLLMANDGHTEGIYEVHDDGDNDYAEE